MDFREVNKQNLRLAYEIQKEIFPESPDILHIKNSIDSDEKGYKYWIVFEGESPIGISGIYTVKADSESVWLSWYGVLPSFRSRGFGRKILLESIEKCKSLEAFKYLRLYTAEMDDDDDSSALPLYDSVMDLCEKYENQDDDTLDNTALIYSYSLTSEKVLPWDDRYAELNELHELCDEGEEYIKKYSNQLF
ncbi:N-acetyltransferase [Paenibacillaceae bacterium]|nr:N-acetyltransferase [Paenibacillaceae bacterium]